MKNMKSRNREHRTKPTQPGDLFTIHLHLPRDAYNRMKDMERRKLYTKDEIFLLGLRATEIKWFDPHLTESGWEFDKVR